MIRGRRIAFDFGDVRTGVAVCDPDGIICTPLPALKTQDESFLSSIQTLLDEYSPIYIVVGEPRHLSGAPSLKMESVAQFIHQLEEITELPIRRIDERLSTVNAASKLRAAGKDSRLQRDFIDSAAAAEILEAALSQDRAT